MPTTQMRKQLRRMIAEPTPKHYNDDELDTTIERYPLHDIDGNPPFVEGTDGNLIENSDWTATYDLNAAAADIWLEKAGGSTEQNYDMQESSSGRSNLWRGRAAITQNAMKMHRIYQARRAAKSVAVRPVDDATFGESAL